MKVPKQFEKRYKEMFDNYDLLLEFSLKPLKKSIRVNTLKISVKDLKKILEDKGFSLERIPWVNEGFWVEWENGDKKRFDLGNTFEHFLGLYYVQEAASMIPPLVLEPKENEIVLDLAAAPGSKTTQIAMYMKNKGTIVANDKNFDRIKILSMNIQRMGVTNTIITRKDGRNFRYLPIKFDKVLLDAPCSATGAIRKSYGALINFNLKNIFSLSKLQRQLIESAFLSLKEGGILVYSTCSIDVEENEAVVDWLLKKYENAKLEKIELEGLKSEEIILEWKNKRFNDEIKKCFRIMPYQGEVEGFFIAKIKKLD
ncbi:MAG TPA: RsmB/NOP family class I SAM-dependent RNA methyltransferase [Nautiliaceae bacterium]|nr:RsmB/NOP family class I SAM-dependent RNA methyltransferase [Nautiliaceae bacterium]